MTTKNKTTSAAVSSTVAEAKDKQRTMFLLTLSNPEEYGYSMNKIEEILQTSFKGLKYYCISYEHAPTTGMAHFHLFFICNKVRWDTVRRRFPHSHIENEVQGTPKQVRDYIAKEAQNLSDEKKESLNKFVEWGVLPTTTSFNKENLLEEASKMIEEGKTPTEIFEMSILFLRYESIIKKAFYAKRFKETPVKRDVKLYYHVGASGSGKSYTYVKLCEQYGADNVFITSDFTNKGTALFDGYTAEKYLCLDELKPDAIPYSMLLNITDCYRMQVHCRYANAYALYSEVHITSVFPPEKLYEGMVSDKNTDTAEQLFRRIYKVIYHYKDKDANFCTFELDGKDYTTYDDLLQKVHEDKDGFIPADKTPFDVLESNENQMKLNDTMPFD